MHERQLPQTTADYLEEAREYARIADAAGYNTPGMALNYADMYARLASASAQDRIANALERLVQFTQELDLHELSEAFAGLG
jgi:hypothetical protein